MGRPIEGSPLNPPRSDEGNGKSGAWTPGPWANRRDDFIEATATGQVVVEQVNNELGEMRDEEITANANLIAAAPDLYAALKAVLVMSDRGPEPKKLYEALSWRENDERARAMANAALAKARGEQ